MQTVMLFLVMAVPCNRVLAQQSTSLLSRWTEIRDQAGIDFVHTNGSNGNYYIVESVVTGIATFDYDGDGLIDIYLLNGAPLPGTPAPDPPPRNRLFKNMGDGTFRDVTELAGVGDTGYSLGVVAGDYDNDGDNDLYVSNFGPNRFYINNGDGRFEEATDWTDTAAGDRLGAGVAFTDIDLDGDLDLLATNYVKFRPEQNIIRMIKGYRFHPGPVDYPPERDLLFINNGAGRFYDGTASAGLDAVLGRSMGVLATDVDEDGDPDLAIAVDSGENLLWINDGGHFREEALLAGFALDGAGRANGNMGIDGGDVDGDGCIDLLTTTFQEEMPVLYRCLGGGLFEDATNLVRLDHWLTPHVNWGCILADFDLDGDPDAFIACGHFMDNIQYIDDRTTMRVRNLMMENVGGYFRTVTPDPAADGLAEVLSSRGAAADDLDGDGDLDLVIVNFNDVPSVLRNELPAVHHWLRIRLVGTAANRSGVGARVQLVSGGRRQVAEVYAGRGYQSHYGADWLTFGLGRSAEGPVEVEVRWPGGDHTRVTVTRTDCEVVLVEGGPVAYLAPSPESNN